MGGCWEPWKQVDNVGLASEVAVVRTPQGSNPWNNWRKREGRGEVGMEGGRGAMSTRQLRFCREGTGDAQGFLRYSEGY